MIGQKGIPAHSGGVEQHVEILARLLARRGHQIDVYCRRSYLDQGGDASPPDAWHEPGVQQIFHWSAGTKHLDAISHTVLCTIDALGRGADVIHYHALGPASLSFIPSLAGRRVVVTVHGLDWQRAKWGRVAKAYLKLGERVAAAWACQLVVVSRPLQDYFRQQYGRETIFIPNGVREMVPCRVGAMEQWGLSPGQFILNVARLVPEKGQHYLIEAFQQMLTEVPAPGLRLVIAGGSGPDTDYEKRLRAMAGPRVIFTGAVGPDVLAELYGNAYFFVLPSEIEGMSLALLEALASGLPALVSNIPENTSVIGRAGFTFRSGDVAHLSGQLRALLGRPELVRQAASAAPRVAQRYRWSNVVVALEETYERAIRQPRDQRRGVGPTTGAPAEMTSADIADVDTAPELTGRADAV